MGAKEHSGENVEPRPLLQFGCGTRVWTRSHPTIDVWYFYRIGSGKALGAPVETLDLGTGHGATRGAGEVSFAEK